MVAEHEGLRVGEFLVHVVLQVLVDRRTYRQSDAIVPGLV